MLVVERMLRRNTCKRIKSKYERGSFIDDR